MRSKIIIFFFVLLFIGLGVIGVKYYSYIFTRTVTGKVVAIDRLTQPSAIIGPSSQIPASQMFSFAVAIKDKNGEIVTASSEDRQWGVVENGQCAEAKFFPYPPWHLDKAGTYYGARLLKLFDCVDQMNQSKD